MALRNAARSSASNLSSTLASGAAAPSSHSSTAGRVPGFIRTIVRRRSARSAERSYEPRSIQVGQGTAHGGQGQAKPARQRADAQRAVAQMLQRSDVAGTQGGIRARDGLVLVAAHGAHHSGEQAHEAQARRRMPGHVRFC